MQVRQEQQKRLKERLGGKKSMERWRHGKCGFYNSLMAFPEPISGASTESMRFANRCGRSGGGRWGMRGCFCLPPCEDDRNADSPAEPEASASCSWCWP